MLRQLAIATILTGLTTLALADVYRIVDAQGRIQYTDRWQPGAVTVKVDKNHLSAEAVTAQKAIDHTKLSTSNDRIAAQQAEQAAAKAVQKDLAKTHDSQCKDAKERYQKAIQARRIYKPGSKEGEREYLSEAEAETYRLEARKDMDSVCGPDAMK
jgi:hypothetical protein